MSGEDRFVLCMLAPAVAILGLLVAYPVGLLIFDSFFKVDTITQIGRAHV